jgi:S1-C subfamily serine protease
LKNGAKVAAWDAETRVKYQIHVLTYKSHWPDADYAIFGYTSNEVPLISYLTTARIPEVGESISTIEGPLGLSPFTTHGFYSGRARDADDPKSEINGMYWIQLPSAPGSSGSPVFDRDGRVWGILVGGSRDLPGMALVVPIPVGLYGLGQ